MRVAVPCFGQLRLFSLVTGAAFGFLLACGSPGDGGLFSTTRGGASSSGGAGAEGGFVNTGGSAMSSGGDSSSSGGKFASGGAATGGSASATGGVVSAVTGGAPPTATGGAPTATGGAAPTVTGGAPIATGGAASATGGTAPVATGGGGTGGALATGGAESGGAPATGGAPASGGQGGGGQAGAPSTGGSSTGGLSSTGGASGTGGSTGGCSAKATEICDGLDNNCNDMIDEGMACPAKCTGFAWGDHGYMVCNLELNAKKASDLCAEKGMRLAWIESADENAALLKEISSLDSSGRGGGLAEVSIGASDVETEGRWHWLDGADFWKGGGKGSAVDGAYTNWAEGRPNNDDSEMLAGEDCAVLVIDQPDDGEPGQWNDTECSLSYGVLCEVP